MDKKLTDSEIVKALECCTKGLDCKNCPANPHKGNYGYCTGLLLKDTLDLINRLQAENERLKSKLEPQGFEEADPMDFCGVPCKTMERIVEVEIDKLNAEKNDVMYHKVQIKAEAYKEFAERLCEGRVSNDNTVILAKCLLKELVGEDNG